MGRTLRDGRSVHDNSLLRMIFDGKRCSFASCARGFLTAEDSNRVLYQTVTINNEIT